MDEQAARPDDDGARGGLSFRGLLMGVLGAVVVAVTYPYVEYIIRGTYPANSTMPTGAMAYLFVLVVVNAAVGRIAAPLGLDRRELTAVFVSMLITSCAAHWGMVGQVIPYLAGVRYYSTPENHWWETIGPTIEPWLLPHGEKAIRWFFEGLPSGEPIPWSAWWPCLLVWAVFATAFLTAAICLCSVWVRHWILQERLVFPLIQLPLEMVNVPHRGGLPALFHDRAMWVGFALTFALVSAQGLHFYIPAAPVLIRLRRGLPISLMGVRGSVLIFLNFAVIAFAYLAKAQVAFSLAVFGFIALFADPLLLRLGIDPGPMVPYGAGGQVISSMAFGGMVVVVAYSLWFWLRDQRRAGAGRLTRADRRLLWTAFGGFVVMIWWMAFCGLPVVPALVFVVGAMITFLALTRGIAQGGIPVSRAALISQVLVLETFGNSGVGHRGMGTLAMAFPWSADIRVHIVSFYAHAMKMWEEVRGRRRDLLLLSALAVLVSFLIGGYTIIRLAYQHGGGNFDRTWLFYGAITYAFTAVSSWIEKPIQVTLQPFWWMLAGGLITDALSRLHYTFLWWPLSPLGFIIGWTQPGKELWFDMLLGWAVKVAVLRAGGLRLYRKVTPFVLGMAMGQFVASGVWVVIDAFTGATGHRIFIY